MSSTSTATPSKSAGVIADLRRGSVVARLIAGVISLVLLLACEKPTQTTSAAGSSSSLVPIPQPSPGASALPTLAPVSATSARPAAPDAIAAQHVLVAYKGADKAPKSVTRSKAEAKKRVDEVAAKAKSGTDFSALVAEYSDDPAAKERQGSLGKFTRDKMAKSFSDAAFALTVDETSAAVETPFGYHVIKRNQ